MSHKRGSLAGNLSRGELNIESLSKIVIDSVFFKKGQNKNKTNNFSRRSCRISCWECGK